MRNEIVIPADVKVVLNRLVESLKDYFREDLTGVYLHGSLPMGGYNPVSSDIDVLVIVRKKLLLEQRKAMCRIMVNLSQAAPAKGFELSIVALKHLREFVFPTPYEFHFGMDHFQSFIDGDIDLTDGKSDVDLAAHFVITKSRGIRLYGQPIAKIFPDVPEKDYLTSIVEDARCSRQNIFKGAQTGKIDVPVYGILNFCRVIGFVKEGLILSKLEGGNWGLENLPAKFHSLITEALREKICHGGGQKVDAGEVREFAEYSFKTISDLTK